MTNSSVILRQKLGLTRKQFYDLTYTKTDEQVTEFYEKLTKEEETENFKQIRELFYDFFTENQADKYYQEYLKISWNIGEGHFTDRNAI